MATRDDEADKAEEKPKTRSRTGRFFSFLIRLIILLAVGIGMFAAAGFFRFANSISAISVPADPKAHAIVVLTGGSKRIQVAVDLLKKNAAAKLLISGVNKTTTASQLAKLTGAPIDLFEKRVDLDHRALNTAGNAKEIAAWAKKAKYEALIVVTSAYHMPRSLTELKSAFGPKISLIAYPVSPEDIDLSRWYQDVATIRLLFSEYAKFMLVKARVLFRGSAP